VEGGTAGQGAGEPDPSFFTMPTPEELKQRIEAAIPGAHAEVEDYTGGGDHFRATVTAEAFAGRSRIEQHRLVYEVFGAEIGGPIHALSLKTETG
jgi:stress-induced morphogen